MRSRRIVTLAALSLATGLATVATTTPATASGPGPRPVTTWLQAVPTGETSWVSVSWTTGRKICDAAMTVEGDDVRIGYPGTTGTHTSFSRSDKLKPGRPDYTAFTVRPTDDEELFLRLEATLSYHTCGRHPVEKARTYRLTLPVSRR
ncbi:hypothetical protein DMB66_37775 [Actinoplanes sp. ATCC 53533]|uniref:hypothetical protein n=1 Tax=Actinoplanes sp. ATCC 53533 TaxID=1288362 RepID=UPI000F76C779|nr:hypothetical protein [Actinoplanes sp. ATCC 53533]RSM54091.1 hypothetical protein DMB66_37775 [Actinoplanes sp. ATCC 53533]